ncbi:MAG: nuclear transport factor 2 family protein [Saprospiraceae bacterium]|nr:nuclear transport factor 2 family protein [Saprospiraceae bacterium]
MISCDVEGQSHEDQIRDIREASNRALKDYDHAKVLGYLTEDVLVTTGAGTLIAGKDALRKYIASSANKMYWVRSTEELIVHEDRSLAWESGTWNGYDPAHGKEPVVGGKYSAMWKETEGEWKISSQLFVTLFN